MVSKSSQAVLRVSGIADPAVPLTFQKDATHKLSVSAADTLRVLQTINTHADRQAGPKMKQDCRKGLLLYDI